MGLNWRNCRGGGGLPGPGGRGVGLDLGQGHERRAQGGDLLGRYPLEEPGVNRLHPPLHRADHLLAARGQREGVAPAVARIGVPLQIPPAGQDLNRLADGLLGDAQPGGQVRPRTAGGGDPGQQGGAVPGQVIDADGVQFGPDGLRVHAAGGAHQSGSGKFVRVRVSHEARITGRKVH